MTSNAVVVVAVNDDYLPFLREQLHSFHACGADRLADFAVIDVGLSPKNAVALKRAGVAAVIRPEWPVSGLEDQPEWHKALICRPFLPRYFPAWDVVVSVDADNWFQTGEGLDAIIAGALQDGFAVVPLADRGHWHPTAAARTLESMQWHRDSLVDYYGEDVAARFQVHPIIVGSFFAGRREAPHWAFWQQRIVDGLRRRKFFTVDQASLTLTVHQAGLPVHFLPLHYHWVAHLGLIGLDARAGRYVEPFLPHAPLSTISLAARTKNDPVMARTTDGRMLARLLRPGRQQERYAVNISIGAVTHGFDGIATARFRDAAFAAVGAAAPARFVQIGAMDGVAFDPIDRPLRRQGWTGLCVEPLPDMMERLQRNRGDLPGIRYAQVAVAEECGRRAMRRVRSDAVDAGRLPSWAAGIASLAPERNALGGRGLTPEQHAAVTAELDTLEVECLDFATLAERHDIAEFDLLQIDTEGYDWRILRQIDLARHRPACVHVEIACLPDEEIVAMLAFLRQAGYVAYVMDDGKDILALRVDFGQKHFGIL